MVVRQPRFYLVDRSPCLFTAVGVQHCPCHDRMPQCAAGLGGLCYAQCALSNADGCRQRDKLKRPDQGEHPTGMLTVHEGTEDRW